MTDFLPLFLKRSLAHRLRHLRAVATVAIFLAGPLIPAHGQAIPTAERTFFPTFAMPRVEGTLQFALTASESITSGYYSSNGLYTSTNLSGDLAYISPSKTHPTSVIFSAGRAWGTAGQPSATFLNLAGSQVFSVARWHYVLSDSISYLPQTASTGLSGIPGNGDLGVTPVQLGTDSGQGVLTDNSYRVSNIASGSASRQITGKTSFHLTGLYSVLRFLGNNGFNGTDGIDNDSESGTVGLSHGIDARNTVGADYSYARTTFGVNQQGFISQSVLLDYTHQFTRLLGMTVSVGPQRSSSINSVGSDPTLNVAASAALSYSARSTHYSLSYSRGTNSGSGVILGAHSDSVQFSASRIFARVWNASFSSSYTRSTSLPFAGASPFSSQTLIDSVQLSRALGRRFSAFASYTLENQSTSGTAGTFDLFSGLTKVASFGITYSPASLHFGPR